MRRTAEKTETFVDGCLAMWSEKGVPVHDAAGNPDCDAMTTWIYWTVPHAASACRPETCGGTDYDPCELGIRAVGESG